MADDFVGSWERQSLYYLIGSVWGTQATGNYLRIRENGTSFPYVGSGPINQPAGGMGRGLPYACAGDFTIGRSGAAFTTAHPMTHVAVRDLFTLFFQGTHHHNTTVDRVLSPLSADTGTPPIATSWSPNLSKYASLCVKNDGDSDSTSVLKVPSAVISQLAVNIPQDTPGQNGGICEVTASWLGHSAIRATTLDVGTNVDDAATFYWHTRNWSFKIGNAARDFIGGSFAITNAAQLELTAATAPAGAIFGALNATGTVITYFNQDTGANAGATVDDLLDAFEGDGEAPTVVVLDYIYTDPVTGTTIVTFEFPAIITGPPTLSDIGGAAAMTFNWTLAGDPTPDAKNDAPNVTFTDCTTFDAGGFAS